MHGLIADVFGAAQLRQPSVPYKPNETNMTTYRSFRRLCALAVLITTSPAMADEHVATAKQLIACAPPLMHGLRLITESGDTTMYMKQEGKLRGLYIAAEQSLKNGGYQRDYIDATLTEWTESQMQDFRQRNENNDYFEEAFRKCIPVYNGPQLELVNQWRQEQGISTDSSTPGIEQPLQ